MLVLQREPLPAYGLPLISRSGDSRLLTDLVFLFPGGLVDLTWYSGLQVLITFHARRYFKTITRPYCQREHHRLRCT